MTERIYFHLGLDLGQASDFSAISIIEKRVPVDGHNWRNGEITLNCVGLKRFALKTSYTKIVQDVCLRLQDAPFGGCNLNGRFKPRRIPTSLTIDGTGCGRPVVDLFRENAFLQKTVRINAITITGGERETYDDGYFRLPKRNLVAATQIALEKHKLQIAEKAEYAGELVSELENFQMKFTESANTIFGAWREGTHDDLILATAMALRSAGKLEAGDGNAALVRAMGNGAKNPLNRKDRQPLGGGRGAARTRQNRHIS